MAFGDGFFREAFACIAPGLQGMHGWAVCCLCVSPSTDRSIDRLTQGWLASCPFSAITTVSSPRLLTQHNTGGYSAAAASTPPHTKRIAASDHHHHHHHHRRRRRQQQQQHQEAAIIANNHKKQSWTKKNPTWAPSTPERSTSPPPPPPAPAPAPSPSASANAPTQPTRHTACTRGRAPGGSRAASTGWARAGHCFGAGAPSSWAAGAYVCVCVCPPSGQACVVCVCMWGVGMDFGIRTGDLCRGAKTSPPDPPNRMASIPKTNDGMNHTSKSPSPTSRLRPYFDSTKKTDTMANHDANAHAHMHTHAHTQDGASGPPPRAFRDGRAARAAD